MLTDRFLYLRFLLRGAGAEKVLNALNKQGIPIRRVKRQSGRIIICQCKKSHASQFFSLCERFSCKPESLPPPLFSRLLDTLLHRKAFCFCSILFLLLVHLSMQHVWAIRIVDAGPYAGDIRAYLKSKDIHAGMPRSSLSLQQIQSDLEWRYPEAAWIKTALNGVTLQVSMFMGVHTPLVETHGQPGDVVAESDGIVYSIVTFAGTPQVKPGDFVKKGQILIMGQERSVGGSLHAVKARGQVLARIWIEKSFTLRSDETKTLPSGKTCTRSVLHTPFLSLSLTPQPDYSSYDLFRHFYPVGGAWLPIFLTKEHYEEITLETTPKEQDTLHAEARKAAEKLLSGALESGDVVVDKWVDYSMIEMESYAATAVAEVLRDIGRFNAHDGD